MTCKFMSCKIIMYNHVFIKDIPVLLTTKIIVYMYYCYCIYVFKEHYPAPGF